MYLICLGRRPYGRRIFCLSRHCMMTNTNANSEVNCKIGGSGGGEVVVLV